MCHFCKEKPSKGDIRAEKLEEEERKAAAAREEQSLWSGWKPSTAAPVNCPDHNGGSARGSKAAKNLEKVKTEKAAKRGIKDER